MKISDLDYSFPPELIATEPLRPSRVMWVENNIPPQEITAVDLLSRIPAGDVLVINNSKVLPRRIFTADFEILFLHSSDGKSWEVLFPSKGLKLGDRIELPEGKVAELIQKGRPQILRLESSLTEDYFQRVAQLPLPPYIQKARAERQPRSQDQKWYQTAWASQQGSMAAPTASLHFSLSDLAHLKSRGVQVVEMTLHVGLGTFLPVTTEDLDQHEMHAEFVEVPDSTWAQIQNAKQHGHKIWCLGTTVTRALESVALGLLPQNAQGDFCGSTRLMIQPGHQWQVVDRLLTNFHQPQSTLLALVSAFAGLQRVQSCYQWAIERRFRLFSYGDLSVWVN